jgi:hypothetical protein
MTLTAPIRLKRQRRFRSTTRLEWAGPTTPEKPVSATPAAPSQVVLMVDFASPDGRTWWAVGVGDTFAVAIAFARDSCPTDTTWHLLDWNDLYGD